MDLRLQGFAVPGAFGVVVPDLPGCFSAGDTLDEVWAVVEIDLARLSDKVERVDITLPARVLRRIDAAAKAAGEPWFAESQITPTTSRSALSIAFIRSSSRRPNGSLILVRGNVESLSTMTCDRERSPLAGFGSTVTRNAALRRSLVTGHSTTLSRSVSRSD